MAIIPPVTPSLAARSKSPASLLEEGRRIYTRQCTACHTAESVPKYAGRWPGIIRDMAPEAKLTPPQEQAVLAYVLAAEREPAL